MTTTTNNAAQKLTPAQRRLLAHLATGADATFFGSGYGPLDYGKRVELCHANGRDICGRTTLGVAQSLVRLGLVKSVSISWGHCYELNTTPIACTCCNDTGYLNHDVPPTADAIYHEAGVWEVTCPNCRADQLGDDANSGLHADCID